MSIFRNLLKHKENEEYVRLTPQTISFNENKLEDKVDVESNSNWSLTFKNN